MEFRLNTKIIADKDHFTLPKLLGDKYDLMAPGFSDWFNEKGLNLVSSSLEIKARIFGDMGVRKNVVSVEVETVIAVAFILYRHFLKKSPLNESLVNAGYAEGFMKGLVSNMEDLAECWEESKVKKQLAG